MIYYYMIRFDMVYVYLFIEALIQIQIHFNCFILSQVYLFIIIIIFLRMVLAEMKRTTQTITRRPKTAWRVTQRKTNIDLVIIVVV